MPDDHSGNHWCGNGHSWKLAFKSVRLFLHWPGMNLLLCGPTWHVTALTLGMKREVFCGGEPLAPSQREWIGEGCLVARR